MLGGGRGLHQLRIKKSRDNERWHRRRAIGIMRLNEKLTACLVQSTLRPSQTSNMTSPQIRTGKRESHSWIPELPPCHRLGPLTYRQPVSVLGAPSYLLRSCWPKKKIEKNWAKPLLYGGLHQPYMEKIFFPALMLWSWGHATLFLWIVISDVIYASSCSSTNSIQIR